jgi:RNA polymerase sigma factor CnrH
VNQRVDYADEDLAEVAATGDRAAFEVLVRRHKEAMYRFIRRYTGNSEDAYDVLQESFLAAWKALNRYDSARPFLPWLRAIALNKCRDFSRRQTVRRIFLSVFAAEVDRQASPTDPLDSDSRRLDQLDRAVAQLPAFYKEPLLLTTVSGLSQMETAQTLKTTPKAIEMRVRRARKKLSEMVDRREG